MSTSSRLRSGRERLRLRRTALIEVATSEGGPALDELVASCDADLVNAAIGHRLSGPLLNALRDRELPCRGQLERWAATERITRLKVGAALTTAAMALDASGLHWVALKGAVVGSFLPDHSPREYGDVDILVAGRDLEQAISVLTAAGVEEINRNWRGYIDHGCGEVPMVSNGVIIDLHWQLIGLWRVRRHFAVDVDPMLARRRRVKVGDLEVAALDAEDQLLHHALHCGLGGANRLDQLRDLAALSQVGDVDWDEFERRCRTTRTCRLVGHVLDRARDVMGAGPPSDLTRELMGGSGWVRRFIDGRSETRTEPGSAYPAALVRSRRDRRLDALVAGGTLFGDRITATLGRPLRWDAGEEGGELYYGTDAGGAVARREFIGYASRGV